MNKFIVRQQNKLNKIESFRNKQSKTWSINLLTHFGKEKFCSYINIFYTNIF